MLNQLSLRSGKLNTEKTWFEIYLDNTEDVENFTDLDSEIVYKEVENVNMNSNKCVGLIVY